VATPLVCDEGDNQAAAFIVGNAETGEQTFLCPAGMARFGLSMALSLMDPADIVREVEAVQRQVAADGQEQQAPRPSRKRKSKPVAEPAPQSGPVEGVAETPPPAQDG